MFVDYIVRGFDPELSRCIAKRADVQNQDVNETIKELIVAGLASVSSTGSESHGGADRAGPGLVQDEVYVGLLEAGLDDRIRDEILAAASLIP